MITASPVTTCLPSTLEQDGLCIELIRRNLATDTVGFQIFLYQEVTSTNAVLLRLAEAGVREGTVVFAEAQTARRGLLGEGWFSPPGVNLYVSVLFRPPITRVAVPVFSFITSLALTDAMCAEGVPAVIRWPNDILIEGKKVAGTPVAYATAGALVDYVILGAGVNLNVDEATLAAALGPAAPAATSLRAAAGRLIDRNVFAAAFLNFLEKWWYTYGVSGADAVLRARRQRDLLAGRHVEIREVEGAARVLGVDREGCLLVEDTLGTPRRLLAGEIVIRD